MACRRGCTVASVVCVVFLEGKQLQLGSADTLVCGYLLAGWP